MKINDNGGDSIDHAIVILEASHQEGVDAEYMVLAQKFGPENVAWKFITQELLNNDNKFFDKLVIKLNDGSEKAVFFDITDFYDKW